MCQTHRVVKLKFLYIFLFSFLVSISCTQHEEKVSALYKYLVYLPSDYNHDGTKEWPLIIFLHGASLRGDSLEKINKFGIPKLIKTGKEFNYVIISPQCPLYKDWSTDLWFPPTFTEIRQKFRIDTNRVYLTGLSMGGEGTWYISEQHPKTFAAIAPVCGRISGISNIQRDVTKISHLPIWIFHGAKDRVYSVDESDKMYQMLKKNNANVRYTRYTDFDHWATHDSTYKNKELYEWFLTHKRK